MIRFIVGLARSVLRLPLAEKACSTSISSGEMLFPAPRRYKCRCLNPLPSTRSRGDGGISQVPRQPLCEHALLFDPGGPDAPRPLTTHPMLPSARLTASAPHSVTFRGSITQLVRSLSTLRSSDHSDRTPRKTRFPLAANLDGAGLSPAGLLQEVSTLCFHSHRFPLLVAFLAYQPP
jgi:hypothetical protein